jgi:hypothetical protein
MYNDTYVKGAYLDLTPSKPFAKDDTSRKMQMEMNGQWMKNKNLPLMKPNATWTWVDYNLEFKSMVVPVTKGRLTSKNVLILDTPQKIQLMRDHFPQWLIDNHCHIVQQIENVPKLVLPEPALTDEQRRRIQRNKQVALDTLENNELRRKNDEQYGADEREFLGMPQIEQEQPMIHESVEASNGEMVMQAALNARNDNCDNANGSPASPTGAVFDE